MMIQIYVNANFWQSLAESEVGPLSCTSFGQVATEGVGGNAPRGTTRVI
jgi:hypothetical protein